jgi:hypothetical protein
MRTGNKASIVLCICQLPEPAALGKGVDRPAFPRQLQELALPLK